MFVMKASKIFKLMLLGIFLPVEKKMLLDNTLRWKNKDFYRVSFKHTLEICKPNTFQ